MNAQQGDWDLQVPHAEFAYNISVGASMGINPNKVHMGKPPRLALAVLERTGVVSLARNHLASGDLAADRQQRANNIICKHHALTLHALTVETPPSLTCCARSLNSLWVTGHGCTTQPLPSASA